MQTAADLPLIGGHPALDFVNTAEERGHPEAEDVLRTPADLWIWGERIGLLTAAKPAGGDKAELARALAARELLHTLLTARIDDVPPDPAQLAQFAALVGEAYAAATPAPTGDGRLQWRWPAGELASVRHLAVTSAATLLQSDAGGRLKRCPGDHCGWLFLDTSKRGNRRWCSMTTCGQEAKDEQRRSKRRSAGHNPS